MFKLPNKPGKCASIFELADYVEILICKNTRVSQREVVASLGIEADEESVGCESEEDGNYDLLDDVVLEIENRASRCNNKYPYALERHGSVIKLKHEFDKATTVLYKYLLICTRLNMTSDRIHDNEDGALLFEELIADVIKNYLGSTRAKSLVFGTAASGNFKDKVNTLCELVDEGATYRRLDVGKEEAKDGKLDVVGLIPFSDKQPGKLIVFAQCKTGTSWRDQITQLQPEAFCKKWMTEIPRVIPIRALCLCELVNKGEWNHLSIDAGILFDRCRIMDFSDALNSELVARIEKWVKAAEEKIKDML